MVHVVAGVPGGELRSQGILHRESIIFSLEEGCFGEPVGREYLELVRVLAWLQDFSLGELDYDLLHRDDLFDLAVVVFDGNDIFSAQVATLDSVELNYQVSRVERSADLDVNRARDGFSGHVAQLVVVEVDIDDSVGVYFETLVPEDSCVFLVTR